MPIDEPFSLLDVLERFGLGPDAGAPGSDGTRYGAGASELRAGAERAGAHDEDRRRGSAALPDDVWATLGFLGAPVAMLVLDEHWRVRAANAGFERLMGRARGDVVGRRLRAVDLRAEGAFEGDGAQQGSLEVDLRITAADGRAHDVRLFAARLGAGATHGTVLVFIDVSEQRERLRQLSSTVREVVRETAFLTNALAERTAALERGAARRPADVQLTGRERDVLARMSHGDTNERIARQLSLAPSTVRNYVSAIYTKLGVSSRGEAIAWARDRGIGGG